MLVCLSSASALTLKTPQTNSEQSNGTSLSTMWTDVGIIGYAYEINTNNILILTAIVIFVF